MSIFVYSPMENTIRRCPTCCHSLPRSAFNRDRTKRDGLTSRCIECSRAASSAWYRENRTRALAEAAARHAANPQMNRAAVAKYVATHPERRKAAGRRYYEKNKEKVKAAAKAAGQANPEERRARSRAYNKAHPDQRRAASIARRARKMGGRIGDRKSYNAFVKWVRTARSIACYWCRKRTTPRQRHIDHVIPLIKGGVDVLANVCVACRACNQRKSAKLPEDFAGQSELQFS